MKLIHSPIHPSHPLHPTTKKQVMGQIDVLYMTRVQKERFPTQADYDAVKDVFKITPETMAMVRLFCMLYVFGGRVGGFGMLLVLVRVECAWPYSGVLPICRPVTR